ncbi:MAG: hypothetical protein OXU22_00470 [Gammaproteobacteria bacterium]|nr:hypothetical protein [Gammaproteobacteria bacterium]
MFGAAISAVGGIAKSWLGNKVEETKAKGKVKLAELNNRARLLQDKNSNNHSWEMASLKSSGKALKWASFTLFTLPILVTVVGPFVGAGAGVEQMWANFNRVPDGWMTVYYSMTGSIWGVATLKDSAPAMVSGIASALRGGKTPVKRAKK